MCMTSKTIGALIALIISAGACNKSLSWSPGSTTPSSNNGGGGGGGGSTSSDSGTVSGGGDGAFANTATSTPEVWKKYEVRGIQLGMSRKELVAKKFTCGKRANSRCYKLMDKRCDQGRCDLKEDAFGQWFELNGAKTDLDYMSCATTETDAALIYDCNLMFGPRQLLAPDSTLGKALAAKYGQASYVEEAQKEDKVGGGRMLWRNEKVGTNAPNITVECNGTNMEGPQCSLNVNDGGLMSAERAHQQDLDVKHKHDTQPATAPAL